MSLEEIAIAEEKELISVPPSPKIKPLKNNIDIPELVLPPLWELDDLENAEIELQQLNRNSDQYNQNTFKQLSQDNKQIMSIYQFLSELLKKSSNLNINN